MVSDCGSAVEVTTDNPKVTGSSCGRCNGALAGLCSHGVSSTGECWKRNVCSTPHCQAQYSPYLTVGAPIVHLNTHILLKTPSASKLHRCKAVEGPYRITKYRTSNAPASDDASNSFGLGAGRGGAGEGGGAGGGRVGGDRPACPPKLLEGTMRHKGSECSGTTGHLCCKTAVNLKRGLLSVKAQMPDGSTVAHELSYIANSGKA